MIVVKFGGSSLVGAQRMLAAARIVASHTRDEQVVCVVSAMACVTAQLITIATQALAGSSAWRELYIGLRARHEEALVELTPPAATNQLSTLAPLWDALEADAALVTIGEGRARDEAVAVFSAWGERLSVRLFQAALARVGLEASCFEDAPVIVEHDTSLEPSHWTASVAATCAWLRDPIDNLLRLGQTPVLPGYLALRQDGQYTTLGRNGSDHSAAVIAAALDASTVYLYSDVAGIFQADPHLVPQAKLLTALTYDEAAAIAARGARVLHPATLPPLALRRIPLRLRSAFNPAAPGTDIGLPKTYVSVAFLHALAVTGCGAKVGRPDAF